VKATHTKTIKARCEAYSKIHQLSWALHNAPLGLLDDPERISKKLDEALQICQAAHRLAKKKEQNNEDE